MTVPYEAFFGLVERPFSLTPDPKFFYKSRSHGRSIETLTFALRRRERFLVVTGDVGIGKTMLCRTLAEQLRRKGLVSFVRNPLLTPGVFYRLLLEDFAGQPDDRRRLNHAPPEELRRLMTESLASLRPGHPIVVVVDEAHTIPPSLVEHILSLAALERQGDKVMQFVLVGQAPAGEATALGVRAFDERGTTHARLLPLGRDECADYVAHRLAVAGAGATASFTPRAIDGVYVRSGGVPRLVNLLCERALQDAALVGTRKIEPSLIEAAATELDLVRPRPRRFRWFSRRVS